MIKKLLAGGAVLAVGLVAVMLLSLGSTHTKPAEAHTIGLAADPSTKAGADADVVVTNSHEGDTYVQASAGWFFDCEDAIGAFCDLEASSGGIFPFTYTKGVVDSFNDPGGSEKFQLEWAAPQGFAGGAVSFFACQEDQAEHFDESPLFVECKTGKTTTIQVVGAPAKITLVALREYSETSRDGLCQGQTVYVIGSTTYGEEYVTAFDNDRAIMCAMVTDSVGHPVPGESLSWTVTGGGCLDEAISITNSMGVDQNRLWACSTGVSGAKANVTVTDGVLSNVAVVQFGGDAVSCALVASETAMQIGDSSHLVATWLDATGNWVPDGILAHYTIVDSNIGGAALLNVTHDTVKGVTEADVIAALAGTAVVGASLEHTGGVQPVCSDELTISSTVHQTPIVCKDSAGNLLPSMILAGFTPPLTGGWGTFQFCGGTWAQLFAASKCPAPQATSSSIFFYNKPDGTFVSWIPGSQVAAPNASILAMWPETIPAGTIFTARCV